VQTRRSTALEIKRAVFLGYHHQSMCCQSRPSSRPPVSTSPGCAVARKKMKQKCRPLFLGSTAAIQTIIPLTIWPSPSTHVNHMLTLASRDFNSAELNCIGGSCDYNVLFPMTILYHRPKATLNPSRQVNPSKLSSCGYLQALHLRSPHQTITCHTP